jgi:hypothetical protein
MEIIMRSLMLHILIFIAVFPLFSQNENIVTYYRDDNGTTGRLELSNNKIHIVVLYRERHGDIEGRLKKINDSTYYAVIEEKEFNEKCLLVVEVHTDEVLIKIYGDQVGAGAWVYYDGIYKKHY